MKISILALAFVLCGSILKAQTNVLDTAAVPLEYFVTHDRVEYLCKLAQLPAHISTTDDIRTILNKLEKFLQDYQPSGRYSDDVYAKESNTQALISVREGGYGIGAILIDSYGKIIAGAHNEQIQHRRSDLHGEMTLLTKFEESVESRPYMNLYVYNPGMTVFSSAEPCPMCFIRLATAGLDTRFATPGPEDGMVSRINCLPPSWQALASKRKFSQGKCSPLMMKVAHLLFFSFLLDDRGPK